MLYAALYLHQDYANKKMHLITIAYWFKSKIAMLA